MASVSSHQGIDPERLAELCASYRARSLEIFGSATRDDSDATTSDVDFLVEFEPMPPAEHADCYFGLPTGSNRSSAGRSISSK